MATIMELMDELGDLLRQQKELSDLIAKRKETIKTRMELVGEDKIEYGNTVAYWRTDNKVKVGNWNNVMKYVKDNDAFDILQKRISPAALKRRMDAGAVIDGIEMEESKTFIVTTKGEKGEED